MLNKLDVIYYVLRNYIVTWWYRVTQLELSAEVDIRSVLLNAPHVIFDLTVYKGWNYKTTVYIAHEQSNTQKETTVYSNLIGRKKIAHSVVLQYVKQLGPDKNMNIFKWNNDFFLNHKKSSLYTTWFLLSL